MSVQTAMHRKIGPLPVYAWAGIVTTLVLGIYLYRRRAGQTAAPDGTVDQGAGTTTQSTPIDPTTGLPYAGGGIAGSGSTNVPTDGAAAQPSLATEIGDVAALRQQLQESGLFQTPDQVQADPVDLTPVTDAIAGLQASLQKTSDHSAPAGGAAQTTTRPSASHGGKLWVYRVNSNGKLTPLHAAPAGAKAAPTPSQKAGSTSGAHTAPNSGSSGTTGKSVKTAGGNSVKVGSIVQKHSPAHGNQLWDFRVNANGTLTPVRKAK